MHCVLTRDKYNILLHFKCDMQNTFAYFQYASQTHVYVKYGAALYVTVVDETSGASSSQTQNNPVKKMTKNMKKRLKKKLKKMEAKKAGNETSEQSSQVMSTAEDMNLDDNVRINLTCYAPTPNMRGH